MRTVVLGGYGNFGARISRALAGNPGIELTIAGRDLAKARELARFCDAQAAAIDAGAPDLEAVLRGAGTQLVIHTAGPFQEQGYGVARAAAAAGAHYIDLADGRRFVCDFPAALDSTFREQARVAISGASTVPALSSAVIDHLSAGWRQVLEIDMCIGPAQTAPRGAATMAAVLSYAGAPIQVWRDGRWHTEHGWSNPRPVTFARLRPRLSSLCDIPDLELFPAHYGGVKTVQFGAALELAVSQHGMSAIARLCRSGILKRPEKLARLMNRAAGLLDPLGSALGGMVVRIQGIDAHGATRRREWHIAADHDHGPEIPCMAAILLARKLAAGGLPMHGAYTSTSLLTLAEFAPEFAKWGMECDIGA